MKIHNERPFYENEILSNFGTNFFWPHGLKSFAQSMSWKITETMSYGIVKGIFPKKSCKVLNNCSGLVLKYTS
jgi:hypothetical protein